MRVNGWYVALTLTLCGAVVAALGARLTAAVCFILAVGAGLAQARNEYPRRWG